MKRMMVLKAWAQKRFSSPEAKHDDLNCERDWLRLEALYSACLVQLLLG